MSKEFKILAIGVVILIIGGAILFITNTEPRNNQTTALNNNTNENTRINTKTLEIGQKAPDFSVTTIDGVELSLSDFEGKILVLTSGAAWCPTCIIENKNFKPVYEEVKNKDVEFMTIDIDPIDSLEAVREFQALYAPWHNVHVSTARELINDYNFWRFEITYIIDKDGIIRFTDSRITETDTLREELNKLI